ncbi:MAG: hypothetical protein GY703_08895 [Gammaproteobacteria bacterium]|nr:hypothetical protein [Gammaproteobacteria bacterium]
MSDEQYKSIQALGRLNGIALQCNYLADTRRMKAALIKTLPRRRELGMAFDQATNESFLQFMEEGRSCPESGSFSGTVDRGIGSLEHSFPGSKAK